MTVAAGGWVCSVRQYFRYNKPAPLVSSKPESIYYYYYYYSPPPGTSDPRYRYVSVAAGVPYIIDLSLDLHFLAIRSFT